MEPTPYVVTGWPASANDLMVAPATTHVASPTALTRFLPMDVSLSEPQSLATQVHTCVKVAHRPFLVADESVARC